MTSVFTGLVGTWFAILYLRITFPMYSWCATRNPVHDSTYHLVDLKSVTTESRNVSPCMTATPWSRVNWKMCDENSTFCCFDAICTQFSLTWPHCGTVHDFFGSFNWPRLPSWIGFLKPFADYNDTLLPLNKCAIDTYSIYACKCSIWYPRMYWVGNITCQSSKVWRRLDWCNH